MRLRCGFSVCSVSLLFLPLSSPPPPTFPIYFLGSRPSRRPRGAASRDQAEGGGRRSGARALRRRLLRRRGGENPRQQARQPLVTRRGRLATSPDSIFHSRSTSKVCFQFTEAVLTFCQKQKSVLCCHAILMKTPHFDRLHFKECNFTYFSGKVCTPHPLHPIPKVIIFVSSQKKGDIFD